MPRAKQKKSIEVVKNETSESAEFNWNFTDEQRQEIAEFGKDHEIMTIYQTANGTAEIEYADKDKKVLTSIFITPNGLRYAKRTKVFGATVSESILSAEEFFEKFPVGGNENSSTAPATETAKDHSSSASVQIIPLSRIAPSYFEPQAIRRRKFKDEDIEELGNSIVRQGLISPIVVRPIPVLSEEKADYEIVVGERRWLASKKKGLSAIKCFVQNLSDEAALEIQMQENLQRVDVDPLDEAFSYKYYLEHTNHTVLDLSIKFGKSERFINQRLKLNDLLPEVLEDIAAGHLPLGHAMEIAKLAPEVQKAALDLCYEKLWENGELVPDKEEVQSFNEFRADLEREIFLSLKKARFSLEAENLRDDGLACVKCPERTGAAGNLFEDLHDAGNDRCLNAACYQAKTRRFIQITREEISNGMVACGEAPQGWKMPLISWMQNNASAVERAFGERPLVDDEYVPINQNTGECEFAEAGIFVDKSNRYGEVITLCRSKDCDKHKKLMYNSPSSSSGSSSPGEKTDEEKRAFYKRKQEIFDIKVGEPVRRKVLREAAQKFGSGHWVFDREVWLIRLVARIWDKIDSNAREVITEALGREKHSISPGYSEASATKYFAEKFTSDELSRILFLAIVANECEMLWGSWRDQKGIHAIAEEFEVNYALLDATERLERAPKKYKEAAQEYFDKVSAGKKVERPVFYKLEK